VVHNCSEFGYICANAPDKAEEIVTGALQTVHEGALVTIESTAAGQDGYFYDFCMKAKKMQDEKRKLTPQDFKLFFFPWYIDPKYTLNDPNLVITRETEEYFTALEKGEGIKLTEGQKAWYIKKRELLKDKIYQEFPSTFSECFRATIEGQFFKDEMQRVYEQNRIRPLIHDPNHPVETWWDLGMRDETVILLTQTIGDEIRFIDMHIGTNKPLSYYIDWLSQRKATENYRYSRHHLPHDVEVKELGTGISRKQILWDLGMRDIRVGTKVPLADSIENVRRLFHRFVIDEKRCAPLHQALFAYRREFDPKHGVFKENPVHNAASHKVDPCRLLAELWRPIPAKLDDDLDSPRERVQTFFG
jgi:hypothetical protein